MYICCTFFTSFPAVKKKRGERLEGWGKGFLQLPKAQHPGLLELLLAVPATL